MIHQVNEEVPLEETIRGLNRLQDEGLVRHIGVSNFALARMIRAQAASHTPIVANQVHYSLVFREPELELLDYCQRHGTMLIAWRPVRGLEAEQVESEPMRRVCAKYGKTPGQIAINWLISQANVTTIAAMRSVRHLPENLGALDFTMDPSDVELLRRELPGIRRQSDAVPLQ